MKRLLTAGIFGTILGIVGTGTANASIVSSGFLDEKLTEYALSTSLDLKANQSDLTALNDIVGRPTDRSRYENNEVYNYFMKEYYNYYDTPLFTGMTIYDFLVSSYTDEGFPGVAGLAGKIFDGFFIDHDTIVPGLKELSIDLYNIKKYTSTENYYNLLILNGGTYENKPIYTLPYLSEQIDKIGTLPTEYATVGAALTAIKGIAEDAKAAALAAIPDPKQEGSSGKFVLTVDIVGDNATYHWEKIDREGETTTTE